MGSLLCLRVMFFDISMLLFAVIRCGRCKSAPQTLKNPMRSCKLYRSACVRRGLVEKNRWMWSLQSLSHHVLSLNMQLPTCKNTHLIFCRDACALLSGRKSCVINLQDICNHPSPPLSFCPSSLPCGLFYLQIPFIIVHQVNFLLTLRCNQ